MNEISDHKAWMVVINTIRPGSNAQRDTFMTVTLRKDGTVIARITAED